MKKLLNTKLMIAGVLALVVLMTGCTKSTEGVDTQLAKQMISNKIWYLEYTVTGTTSRTYVGQSTYFINFLKDNTSTDSDGYKGVYTIEKWNGALEIHIQSQKTNGSALEYKYTIESVGENNLILSYVLTGQVQRTKMYFSNARQ